jgi:hypothetical protein
MIRIREDYLRIVWVNLQLKDGRDQGRSVERYRTERHRGRRMQHHRMCCVDGCGILAGLYRDVREPEAYMIVGPTS